MKTMAEVIESHLMADEDSCDCNEMFYDTRMSRAAIRHEHSLHVEMELHNAGFGPVKAAQAEALRDAADWLERSVIVLVATEGEPLTESAAASKAAIKHDARRLRARATTIEPTQ